MLQMMFSSITPWLFGAPVVTGGGFDVRAEPLQIRDERDDFLVRVGVDRTLLQVGDNFFGLRLQVFLRRAVFVAGGIRHADAGATR